MRHYNIKGEYATYEAALRYLEIPKLAERRESLTLTFAIDTLKSEIHKCFFKEKDNVRPNARFKHIIQEKTCRTDRLKNSAILYMSRLLNNSKIGNP